MGSSSVPGDDLTITLSQEATTEAAAAQIDQCNTEPTATFEPFEPGNIWTQKHPTQFQRKEWRKRVYMEEEEEDGIEVLTSSIQMQEAIRGPSAVNGTENQGRDDESQPWWSKGKTAPLLNDFDNDRRSFYLAQAGIGSSGNEGTAWDQNRHSNLGRRVGERTLGLQSANSTPSLLPITSSIATPRKKTWSTIWGQDGQRSVSNSDKKKRKSSPSKAAATPTRTTRGGKATKGSARKTT